MKDVFPDKYFKASVILSAGLTFASLYSVSAEIVTLKNNKVLEGRIIGQDKDAIRLAVSQNVQIIPKKDISNIKYVPLTEEEKEKKKAAEKKKAEERESKRRTLEKAIAEQKAQEERIRREKELADLEEQIRLEKLREARERAERARALRELVKAEVMEKPKDEPISYTDFAWRSVILPGWGHFYIDKPVFGVIYAAGTAVLAANAYHHYRIALSAKRSNEQEAAVNNMLTLFPVGNAAVRFAYASEANRKFLTDSKTKVDRYYYSLTLLGAFYGLNVLHIIYNGIAWENGLLIVDKTIESEEVSIKAGIFPDTTDRFQSDHARSITASFSVSYYF